MKTEIQKAASALGKLGGSKTSEAKKKSSPENGKKGGRPEINRLAYTLTNDMARGRIAYADIVLVPGSYERNNGMLVYRATDFCLPGEKHGWGLMSREYSTKAALIADAKKMGATPIK